ncbi:hypothetical protein DFP98_13529 [Cohnella phaseoli]|uniref:Uncharacterized protein n=1 Tax=Cohnella phaseoli TaxID=456490 RepID=A0A3D9I815_9BACL|nr:hypothetical protein DFP98_13529 [Cohnella phaseoli]
MIVRNKQFMFLSIVEKQCKSLSFALDKDLHC